jgi:hypothetical protein
MTTGEIILAFLFFLFVIEMLRAVRAWYMAEAKSYELAIEKQRTQRYKERNKKCP